MMEGVIASRNYYPGDLIYSEESFAQVVPRKQRNLVCESCGRTPLILRACKECLAVKYCNKQCQKNDWRTHRVECKNLKNMPMDDGFADFVRLAGKVILKLEGKDWKAVKKQILGKDYSFDDIDSLDQEYTSNPKINLFFIEMKERVGKLIGLENVPCDEQLMKIFGKLKNGLLCSTNMLSLFLGYGMFPRVCKPNTNAAFTGNFVYITACKMIKKGVDKISLRHWAVLSEIKSIDTMCGDQSVCQCTDCSLPYGESMFTKIIDKKRACSVIGDTENFLEAAAILPCLFWERSIGDALVVSNLSDIADGLLDKQQGVLGGTNYLRLRLLAFRCLELGGHPLFLINHLLELEKSMRCAFGDYYSEMRPIYAALGAAYFKLGNPVQGIVYIEKARRIESFMAG